jgi:hypothetical protein
MLRTDSKVSPLPALNKRATLLPPAHVAYAAHLRTSAAMREREAVESMTRAAEV